MANLDAKTQTLQPETEDDAIPSPSSENEGFNNESTPCKRRKIDTLQELCQDTELDQDVNNIACRQHSDEGTPLDDDEVRWLISGVCLHKIISPTLRKYVPQTMQRLYANLKLSDNIDTQTFAHYLRRYTPTNKELNYETINNNSAVPKLRGRHDIQNYDYRVHDEVELSKLFLQTHMAQYTGFDDTCDSSALLGIIINVDIFPAALRSTVEKVRKDIRNEWAHCNFSQWDMHKFQTSFVQMKDMIGCLNLSAQEERDILQLIDTWENNGLNILRGAVGLSVLKELKKETKSLAKYCQSKSRTSDENFKKILQYLTKILDELESLKTRVSTLETQHSVSETWHSVSETRLSTLETQHSASETQHSASETRLSTLETQHSASETRHSVSETRLSTLETQHSALETRLSAVEITAHENKINGLSKHQESNKGTNYFTAPNRIEVFVGREHELKQLEGNFSAAVNLPCIQAISGLGGMGKTSLASEYSWKYREQYPGGVFWVSIESDNTLLDSFQQLASGVGLQYTGANHAMLKFLQWLSKRSSRWLIVADNLDSDELTETMKQFLFGVWKRNTEGHMIITTRREGRNAKETLKVDFCICLDKLTKPESIHFLKTRSATDTAPDDKALCALVKELDGLPLALEQAAAHVKCLQCTYQEYWNEFKTERLRLLKSVDHKSHVKMSRERLAVQTTWNMNFDYIKRQSEKEGLGTAAVTVMEIFALLPADCILLEFLNCNKMAAGSCVDGDKQIGNDLYRSLNSEVKKKQVLAILSRFSVVKVTDDNTAIMHRLVQNILKEEMTPSHRQNIKGFMIKLIQGMKFTQRNWSSLKFYFFMYIYLTYPKA